MLTGIAGECHLLFACNNIGGLFSQACFGEFMLSHTIKSQPGIPFAQSGGDCANKTIFEGSNYIGYLDHPFLKNDTQ